MFVTYGQGSIFLFCVFLGIICGLIYEAGYLIRFCCKKNIIITFAIDAAFCGLCLAVILPSFLSLQISLRAYVIFGVIAGFVLERLSCGYFIAKGADWVYNVLILFKKRFLEWRFVKFLRRKRNNGQKNNKRRKNGNKGKNNNG